MVQGRQVESDIDKKVRDLIAKVGLDQSIPAVGIDIPNMSGKIWTKSAYLIALQKLVDQSVSYGFLLPRKGWPGRCWFIYHDVNYKSNTNWEADMVIDERPTADPARCGFRLTCAIRAEQVQPLDSDEFLVFRDALETKNAKNCNDWILNKEALQKIGLDVDMAKEMYAELRDPTNKGKIFSKRATGFEKDEVLLAKLIKANNHAIPGLFLPCKGKKGFFWLVPYPGLRNQRRQPSGPYRCFRQVDIEQELAKEMLKLEFNLLLSTGVSEAIGSDWIEKNFPAETSVCSEATWIKKALRCLGIQHHAKALTEKLCFRTH